MQLNKLKSPKILPMDFRTTAAITNPAGGHSPAIDEKTLQWGGVEADILYYLSDVDRLAEFADKASNADQLAQYLDPFLDNAKTYLEAMSKLAEGQVSWTELRKQFGVKVANAIQKIRKLNAEFDSDMQLVDARDRAALTKINQKRQHGLAEIATELSQDLQIELWRHQNKLSGSERKFQVEQERSTLQRSLQEERQNLLNRVRYGSAGKQQELQTRIPVTVVTSRNASSVSASGTPRSNKGFGWFGGFWDMFRNR